MLPDGATRLERPVSPEWARLAVERGQVGIVVTYLPWTDPAEDAAAHCDRSQQAEAVTLGLLPAAGAAS